MSYRTYYTISIKEDRDNKILAQAKKQFPDILDLVSPEGYPEFDSSWPDFEQDMREISKAFPGQLFTVYGEGEDSTDIWNAYFLDGKYQSCPAEIVFPPYDPAKLS